MKHLFCLLLLGLLTTACSLDIQENREPRSTVFKGQTTWDMYENFGAPTHAVRISPEEIHFIYRREEVTRDWTKMYFDWCDMVFMTVNDYVVDWDFAGNQCHLNTADEAFVSDEQNKRENALRKYINQTGQSAPKASKKDNYETLF